MNKHPGEKELLEMRLKSVGLPPAEAESIRERLKELESPAEIKPPGHLPTFSLEVLLTTGRVEDVVYADGENKLWAKFSTFSAADCFDIDMRTDQIPFLSVESRSARRAVRYMSAAIRGWGLGSSQHSVEGKTWDEKESKILSLPLNIVKDLVALHGQFDRSVSDLIRNVDAKNS